MHLISNQRYIIVWFFWQTPLHAVDSSALNPLSSVLDLTDSSMKLLNAHPTAAHHQNLGRSIFLKRSRHHYSHQYSRRNSPNHANPSTSRGKVASLRDERLSFKLATQCNSQIGHHSGAFSFPFFFFLFKFCSILPMIHSFWLIKQGGFYFFQWRFKSQKELLFFFYLMRCQALWWYWVCK